MGAIMRLSADIRPPYSPRRTECRTAEPSDGYSAACSGEEITSYRQAASKTMSVHGKRIERPHPPGGSRGRGWRGRTDHGDLRKESTLPAAPGRASVRPYPTPQVYGPCGPGRADRLRQTDGIIEPVVCRQDPATGLVYTVAGERRCAAARKAGKIGDLEFPDFSQEERTGILEAMNSLKETLDEAIPRAVNNRKKPM